MAILSNKQMRKRIFWMLGLCFGGAFFLLIFRLYWIQIHEGEKWQKMAINQQMRSTVISAKRGSIYDRNMNTLAQSSTVWNVFIAPEEIENEEQRKLIVEGLSTILEVDQEKIDALSRKKGSYYETVKTKVEKGIADQINSYAVDNSLRGIHLEEDTKRYYPYDSLASTVLGFTGSENKGAYGLESYYEKVLAGTPGLVVTAKNAKGTDLPFTYSERYDAKDGNNLVLTIDEKVQHFLEKNLETAVVEHKIKNRATGIVMNVKTGEILAMATKPDFNPNSPLELGDANAAATVAELKVPRDAAYEAYKNALARLQLSQPEVSEEDLLATSPELAALKQEYTTLNQAYTEARSQAQFDQWRNKAISDPYEPGSVFKLITAAAALETHAVTPHGSHYNCPGYIKVAGNTIGCWKRGGHGNIDFAQAIKYSCNPAFILTGQALGAENFIKYLDLFGFTDVTGIDLPGESDAMLHDKETLLNPNMASLSSASFGQTFKVTPIQLMTAVSATINGGKLLQPYVVKQVLDSENNVIATTQPVVKRQVIAEEVSKEMALLAEAVVADSDGSGRRAGVPGYRIGGKTGTSEKIDKKQDGQVNEYIMSFYGFAPVDDPEIACLVLLDEPSVNNTYGSVIAAPVVGSVLAETLPYLGFEPTYSEEELSRTDISTPYLLGKNPHDAQSELTQLNLKTRIIGEGATVVRQVPGASEPVPRGGTVILYTDQDTEQTTATVPNVVGMSGQQANRTILNAGLNIRIDGEKIENEGSVAVSQDPPAGETVGIGTVITVTFATQGVEG